MTKIFSMRLDSKLANQAAKRAAQQGLTRTEYVRRLLESDIKQKNGKKHIFASADLIGSVSGDGVTATNKRVREVKRRLWSRVIPAQVFCRPCK